MSEPMPPYSQFTQEQIDQSRSQCQEAIDDTKTGIEDAKLILQNAAVIESLSEKLHEAFHERSRQFEKWITHGHQDHADLLLAERNYVEASDQLHHALIEQSGMTRASDAKRLEQAAEHLKALEQNLAYIDMLVPLPSFSAAPSSIIH